MADKVHNCSSLPLRELLILFIGTDLRDYFVDSWPHVRLAFQLKLVTRKFSHLPSSSSNSHFSPKKPAAAIFPGHWGSGGVVMSTTA